MNDDGLNGGAKFWTVTLARHEDIPELARSRSVFLSELGYEFAPEIAVHRTETYLREHLNKSTYFAVIRDGDLIISQGAMIIQERMFHPIGQNGWRGEILNMYTLPAYRRQGLGMLVLDFLLAYARELRLDSVILNATADGYNLYVSRGFEATTHKNLEMTLFLNLA